MKVKNCFFLFAMFVFAAGMMSGQSIFDNAYHRKALELQKKAEILYDQGDYDASYETSQDAKTFLSLSEQYGTLVYYRYKANGSIVLAKNRIGYAQGIHADENFPEEYTEAVSSLSDAQRLFSEGELSYFIVTGYLRNTDVSPDASQFDRGIEYYIESGNSGKAVLSSLENIRIVVKEKSKPAIEPAPVVAEAVPEPAAEEQPETIVLSVPEPAPQKELPLPRFYTVRLIPDRRDCFWRIAEYGFIYGDPWKWKKLYELNKDKIPDPKNPNWIEPGTVLEIPSLKGEVREGTYDPALTYPSFKK